MLRGRFLYMCGLGPEINSPLCVQTDSHPSDQTT